MKFKLYNESIDNDYMKIFNLLFIFSFFISCSQKQEEQRTASVDLSGIIQQISSSFQGGIILFGTSNQGKSFTRFIQPGQNNIELEMPAEVWDYNLVAWPDDGNGKFSGVPICAKVPGVDLTRQDQDVTMVFNSGSSNCGSISALESDGTFKRFSISVVKDDGGNICDVKTQNNCVANTGFAPTSTAEITNSELNYTGAVFEELDPKLDSQCIDLTTLANTGSTINYPIRNIFGHYASGALEVYKSNDCTTGCSSDDGCTDKVFVLLTDPEVHIDWATYTVFIYFND